MAIIDSKGIKSESGTIKSQTIKRESSTVINRPGRQMPSSPMSSRSLNRNNRPPGSRRNGLNRNNNLRKNRNVAKPSGSDDDKELNPLQKAEQRRKPLNQQAHQRPVNAQGENENNPQGLENQQNGQDQQNGQGGNQLSKPENELEQNTQNQGSDPNLPNNVKEDEDGDGKGSGLGKKIWNFLKKHPMVLVYIGAAILILLLAFIVIAYLAAIFGGLGAAATDEDMRKNYGPFFAFDSASVSLVDPTGTIPVSRSLSLSEYLKGIVYADTMKLNLSSMTNEQILEFYKAVIVARKAQILSKGRYDNRSKQMTLKLTDFNYCDPQYGCKIATKGGSTFYLSNDLSLDVDRTSTEYGALEDRLLVIMNKAIGEATSKIVTPNNVEEPLTTYKWSPPSVSSSTISSYLSAAKSGTKYEDIIKNTHSGYKVYNLDDYALLYESVFISLYTFWWPIGTDSPDASGSYSGNPSTYLVLSKYGPSFGTQTINKGMKIGGTCGRTTVIAPKDGKVTFVGTDAKYGSYVIISHEDNVRTLLGSLSNIKVAVNQEVMQGDLVGIVGKINEDDSQCYVYVEMYASGQNVNPLDYFSEDFPRPTLAKYIKFVQGKDNQQTVCKTLLASGFSRAAVAGLMANIEHESGFKLDALSDNGTSNGLFQWHKGRLDNLRQYCGSEYLTSIKCQLDFFLYEITEGSEKNDGAYEYLMGNHNAYDMAYHFCLLFERPKGGATSAANRGKLAESKYVSYVNNGCN